MIKAEHCYVCLELFELEKGGVMIAKKYSSLFLGEKKKLYICRGCAYRMMEYAKKTRAESEVSE